MKKKLIVITVVFYIFFVSYVSFANEIDEGLQNIFALITNENWIDAKAALQQEEKNTAELSLLWSLWYGGLSNPKYDKHKSTRYLEQASKLGSRDAQLLLIGRYLFSSDPDYTNYSAGVKLATNLADFYENEISNGRDKDGELQRIIGKFYIFGIGVTKNSDHGLDLIKKAAKLGDKEAISILQNKKVETIGHALKN